MIAARDVEWVIDTGADITVVRNSVCSGFDVTPRALSASSTTGGRDIQVVTGLVAEFDVEDISKNQRRIRADGYIGIKPNDANSDLLGMKQLADADVTVSWNPAIQKGSLSRE
jgi:hypothetical protein